MPDPDRRIDPRYDPAFQRGYADPTAGPDAVDGSRAVHGTRAAVDPRRAVGGRPVPHPRATRGASAEEPRASSTAASARVEGRRAETRALAPDGDPRLDVTPEEREADAVESGRNPYEITLLVIGTVLVVASAALINASRGLFLDAPEDEFEYWLLTLAGTVAPAVLAVGMLTLIALLFVQAHRWSLRR